MTFIRTKKVKGKVYRYLCESYRDPDTGQPRQRVIGYLGKDTPAPALRFRQPVTWGGKEWEYRGGVNGEPDLVYLVSPDGREFATPRRDELGTTEHQIGRRVMIPVTLYGKTRQVPGVVVQGTTYDPTAKGAPVRMDYTTPGTVTVAWEFRGLKGTVQIPATKVV